MAEKFSKLLIRIMLAIYCCLMVLGIFMGSFGKLETPSYIAALLCSILLLAAAAYLRPKLERLIPACRRSAFITGLILAFFCAAVNLIWVLCFSIEPTVDFYTFYENARLLAQGKPIDWLYIGLFPHILGYSTFLSIFIRAFGDFPLLAPLLNVALTTISGLTIYILCLRWAGCKAGAFAFFFWSICPSKLMYNALVMSEPLYTCLILLFLLLLSLVCDEGPNLPLRCIIAAPLGLLGGGLLLAVNVVRPLALILMIALFIWGFLLRGEATKRLISWVPLLIFVPVMLLGYTDCSRSWSRWEYLKVYEETSNIPAYNIYVGLNPDTMGSYSEADMDLLLSYRYDPEHGSAVYAQEKMLEEVGNRLSSGKINFPRLFLVKLGKLIGNDEGGAFYCRGELSSLQFSLSSFISNVYYYVLVLLSLTAAASLFRRPVFSSAYIAVLYTIGLILAHMVIEVSGRYKYSIIPMLIILASFIFSGSRTGSLFSVWTIIGPVFSPVQDSKTERAVHR